MNIHEYQAKGLFADYGIPVPLNYPAFTADEAVEKAKTLGGDSWMVKAQVHAGGRGKAGGVKKANSLDEVKQIAESLIGINLVTHQTGPEGQPVSGVMVEIPTQTIEREMYLSMVVDRASRKVAVIVSGMGGMDIEEVAETQPDKVINRMISPVTGIQPYQCQELGFALELDKNQRKQLTAILTSAYRLFVEKDLSMLEINPLIVNGDGDIAALDAKINFDDSALYRHSDIEALYDSSQVDSKEDKAREHDLNYVALDGNIACMVNGAGLAMGTMDIIKLHGGEPANFLDVGGGTTAERVTEAFKLILSDSKVKAILVNIFGGIVRCDLIAEGIIEAVKQTQMTLPVVARLEGTNVEQGKELLNNSEFKIIAADGLTDAAEKVVAAAKGEA